MKNEKEELIHRKTLEYLSFHPEIFGIERKDLFSASSEVVLYDAKGNPYGRTDIVYFLRFPEKGVVVVEFKSSMNHGLRKVGKVQVRRAISHFKNAFYDPVRGFLLEGELPFKNGGAPEGGRKYCITEFSSPIIP